MIIATTGGFMNSVVELITVLVIFLFVLALTYYVTRWIAGYQKTKTAQGNLSVIEAIRISNNQYVHIVRAGKEKYLVVGVGKDHMTLLATLTQEELRELPRAEAGVSVKPGKGFTEILEELKKKHEK